MSSGTSGGSQWGSCWDGGPALTPQEAAGPGGWSHAGTSCGRSCPIAAALLPLPQPPFAFSQLNSILLLKITRDTWPGQLSWGTGAVPEGHQPCGQHPRAPWCPGSCTLPSPLPSTAWADQGTAHCPFSQAGVHGMLQGRRGRFPQLGQGVAITHSLCWH